MAGDNGTTGGDKATPNANPAPEVDAAPQVDDAAPEAAEIDSPEIGESEPQGEVAAEAEPVAESNPLDALYGELFPEQKAPKGQREEPDEDPLERRRQADKQPAEQAGDLEQLLEAVKGTYDESDPLYKLTKALIAKDKARDQGDQERTQQFTQAQQQAYIASERAAAMPLIDGLKMPEIFGTPDSRDSRQQKVAEYVADRMSYAAGALKQIFGTKYPGNAFVAKLVAGVVTGKAMPDPKAQAIKEVRETVRRRSAAAGVPASAGKEKPFKITGIEDARTATLNQFDRKYPGVS